jgi:hypothetical protein
MNQEIVALRFLVDFIGEFSFSPILNFKDFSIGLGDDALDFLNGGLGLFFL